MAVLAPTVWVDLLLTRLPRPLVSMLDAWSYGVARRKAERRRAAAAMKRHADRV
jgi:hypothetical protein